MQGILGASAKGGEMVGGRLREPLTQMTPRNWGHVLSVVYGPGHPSQVPCLVVLPSSTVTYGHLHISLSNPPSGRSSFSGVLGLTQPPIHYPPLAQDVLHHRPPFIAHRLLRKILGRSLHLMLTLYEQELRCIHPAGCKCP